MGKPAIVTENRSGIVQRGKSREVERLHNEPVEKTSTEELKIENDWNADDAD